MTEVGYPAQARQAPGHVLFVDDDEDVLKAAGLLLARNGLKMSSAREPAQAWSALAAEPVDVILLDLNFSRGSTDGAEGFRCLGEILAQDPDAVVVVVTGHSGINIAVAAMRAGASDFVMKPWRNERLVATLESALALRRRRRGTAPRDESLEAETPILGESAAIAVARQRIERAAATDASVLIHGEAGTGKSLMALTLHRRSGRAKAPFAPIDLAACGESRDDLTEAFARAPGGSVFLDEVGFLAPALQSRLLAVIEARRFGPPGADVRLIAATRRRRDELRGPGGLRDDLLYRLNTVEISAPPLRERPGDAVILAEHFLRLFAQRYGRPAESLALDAAQAIAEDPWPGDVRALRQAMERCVIFAEGARYERADIPFAREAADHGGSGEGAAPTLALSERALVARALKRNGFNVSHAARELGLTRAALYRRMAKHGL